MTVKEIYHFLAQEIPSSLSCEWDNDGLMLSGDTDRPVRRILCTLDVTEEAVDYAVSQRFDLIVSHHPLIFRPLPTLTPESHVGRKVLRLLAAGISVISLHTRADAVAGGVNDRLAALLGIFDAQPLGKGEESLCRIGHLSTPLPLEAFCRRVKSALGAPAVLCADAEREVFRVALCGGDGKDFVTAACAAGADTYLSGRIGYHPMTDAPECGMNMIEAGHYYTETHITAFFAELLARCVSDDTVIEEFSSNIILCL